VLCVESETAPSLHAAGTGIAGAPTGTLNFRRPAILRTYINPWARRLRRICRTNEFSLEVGIRPRDVNHTGPGFVVASACCREHLNFALVQVGDSLEMHVATAYSGSGGNLPVLRVANCLAPERRCVVTATYARGTTRLYVDGKERGVQPSRMLRWFSSRAFASALTGPVVVGMSFVGWSLCFLPLWQLTRRRGERSPARALAAAAAALALVLLAVVTAM
jgi:hypothetical protein